MNRPRPLFRPVVAILDGDSRFFDLASLPLRERCDVRSYGNASDFLGSLAREEPDLLVIGRTFHAGTSSMREPGEVIPELRRLACDAHVLIISEPAPGQAVKPAMDPTVHTLPVAGDIHPELVCQAAFGILSLRRQSLEGAFWKRYMDSVPRAIPCPWPGSPCGRPVLEQIRPLVGTRVPVMFEGEHGSGRRTTALWLHQQSGPPDRQFLALSPFGRIADSTEQELFGSAGGTGADWRGILGAVEGSTIYLRDFEDWPLATLRRLVDALRHGFYTPDGTSRRIRVTCRVMCGRLSRPRDAGAWDETLERFWKPCRVHIPPLRNCRDDLAFHLDFIRQRLEANGVTIAQPNEALLKGLARRDLQGNRIDLLMALLRGADEPAPAEDESPGGEPIWSRLTIWPKMRYDDYVLMRYLRAVEKLYGRNLQAWIDHTGYQRATIYRWWSRLDRERQA